VFAGKIRNRIVVLVDESESQTVYVLPTKGWMLTLSPRRGRSFCLSGQYAGRTAAAVLSVYHAGGETD
jgi:hypothetical protein